MRDRDRTASVPGPAFFPSILPTPAPSHTVPSTPNPSSYSHVHGRRAGGGRAPGGEASGVQITLYLTNPITPCASLLLNEPPGFQLQDSSLHSLSCFTYTHRWPGGEPTVMGLPPSTLGVGEGPVCHTLDKTQAQVLPLPLTNYVPVSKSQPLRTRGLITSVLAAPQCCSGGITEASPLGTQPST